MIGTNSCATHRGEAQRQRAIRDKTYTITTSTRAPCVGRAEISAWNSASLALSSSANWMLLTKITPGVVASITKTLFMPSPCAPLAL